MPDLTVEGFLNSFGISQDPPTDPPVDPPADPPVDPPVDPPPTDPPTDPPVDPPADPPVDPPTPAPDTKQAQAFAQMRIENANNKKVLQGIASVLGITEVNDPDKLVGALQKVITEAQAKQQGVPAELLSRLNQLEERDKEFTQTQIAQAAYTGFQKVKDSFGLDDKALASFADELVAAGQNPFTQQMDLVAAYKLMHFDDIVKAEAEKAAKAEAERAAKAANQSTQPNNKSGNQQGEPEKITTIAQLNALFANANK